MPPSEATIAEIIEEALWKFESQQRGVDTIAHRKSWDHRRARAVVDALTAAEAVRGDRERLPDGEIANTYLQPDEGWICFHCGIRFKKYGAALDHFSAKPHRKPACVLNQAENGLAMELRKAEDRGRALVEALRRIERLVDQAPIQSPDLEAIEIRSIVRQALVSHDTPNEEKTKRKS